ncbi:nicotinate-nucleotide adenylyltransferase [Lentiprolixibacter aurantiacus]|uniref:Nicotinate-nucleotide adenylyltransferase n=1 Tax=Lentiprolixibacter aurantiacus TaxID=2993939 RepID=A0AAE3SNQ4_9FLAO|nr:nicotinate-nucleotide adenylyltransferase [Lentiprolixibacter aurantiacus]MCX2718712.1 nicotinate-nucleotide adenylyltransferase [Lentiprolixibacter aurantiacus]
MKKFIVGLFVLGLTSPLFSQVVKTEELSEVVVMAVNYKYLNQVDNTEAAIPVKMLERKAAAYDVTVQDYYQDDFDFYTVSFYIPDGKLVAVYDSEGKIIRTIEKFNNVNLPDAVKKSVLKRYPNWSIVKDVYRVSYAETKGAKKTYKLKLKNGDKILRIKMNEDGEFL